MKKLGLIVGTLLLGITASLADRPSLDPKPLPPGPVLSKAPAFSSWQITFAYGPPAKDGAAPSPANSPGSTLPKLLTVTKTKPQWHAVLMDVSGSKREAWYDGFTRFLIEPQFSQVLVVSGEEPGFQNPYLDYVSGPDFPDMDWVSPQTYLGTQTGTALWVFQKDAQKDPKGPMVWIDSSTRLPVQWQLGGEMRTIRFLPTPTSQLVLPPDLEALSLGTKRLQSLAGAHPGHL